MSAKVCESTVAVAAPRMPQWSTRIKSTSSAIFINTVKIVAVMACRGLLAARSTAFMPKYMWVTTLPSRIICMKLRA